jgi:hypothetical protein
VLPIVRNGPDPINRECIEVSGNGGVCYWTHNERWRPDDPTSREWVWKGLVKPESPYPPNLPNAVPGGVALIVEAVEQ